MNKNLRLFYILIGVTAVVLAVRYYADGISHDISAREDVQFAVKDTASVDRIFISDMNGRSALLERVPGNRYWSLNGRFEARKDAVDLLLKTFSRTRLRRAVGGPERETVMRVLSGGAKKVEIYKGGTEPVKTWYIGTATPNHTGTYMLLEDASGRAPDPYVVHMEGFTGFLSTRFFTDEREWRYTGMFDFPGRSLGRVELNFHEDPKRNYVLESDSLGEIHIWNAVGQRLTYHDTLSVQDQFLRFKKVHLETYNNHLTEEAEADLRASAPDITMKASSMDGAKTNFIELYWKDPVTDTYDNDGNLNLHDGARMYALYKDEVVLVQLFVFEPLIGFRPSSTSD
jgi:hypothetical protein